VLLVILGILALFALVGDDEEVDVSPVGNPVKVMTEAGQAVNEKGAQAMREVQKSASDTIDEAPGALKQAATLAKEKVAGAAQQVYEKGAEIKEKVGDIASGIRDTITGVTDEVVETTKAGAKTIGEKARSKAEETMDGLNRKVEAGAARAGELANQAKDGVSQRVHQSAKDLYEKGREYATNKAEDMASRIKDTQTTQEEQPPQNKKGTPEREVKSNTKDKFGL